MLVQRLSWLITLSVDEPRAHTSLWTLTTWHSPELPSTRGSGCCCRAGRHTNRAAESTVSGYRPAIAALTGLIPTSQILFGSDFPYRALGETAGTMPQIGLSEAELRDDLALAVPPGPASEEGTETVQQILDRLPDNYRRVLELRFLHGYSLKEVAAEMKSTVGAIKVMQLRALRAAAKVRLDE